MTRRQTDGFAPWQADGPWHALAPGREKTWCGLKGPPPEEPTPLPWGRSCRNCLKALEEYGEPSRVDARYRIYVVYSPSRRSVYYSLDPPGRGWLEDRLSSWRIRVRARSRRQALYLASEGIEAEGPGGPGILEILEPDPDAWEV